MVGTSAWAQLYDFESPTGLERLGAAEKLARLAYARQAIKELLDTPVKTIQSEGVICVVVFGRVAFLSEPGGFAVATYDNGVIDDPDFIGVDWLEGLPLRRSVAELKSLIAELAIPKLALAMAEWRGEPVDLRGSPHGTWALEQEPESGPSQLEVDLRSCLAEIPANTWSQLFIEVAEALALDRTLASASCWMMLGEADTGRTYQRLQRMSGVVQAHRARRDRSLIANAIAMAFEKRAPPDSVTSAVKWFREFTAENGVNLVGWRLLLESPLGYWNRLLRQGHDETAVWVALLAGQSCTTPRLPSQFEVRHLVALAYENDVEKVLQHVPPQIWRSLLMQIKGRKRATLTEVSDVLAWAARTGGSMPKTIRRARWSSLRRHAFEHALSRVDCANLRRSLTAHAIVKKNGVVARRITNEGALDQLALVMRNCLRQYAVEVEAGNAVIYFALQGKQRAVILLEQSEPGGAWSAEEVKGPANLPAENSFVEFAWELCMLWNSDESMRPKADGGAGHSTTLALERYAEAVTKGGGVA